MRLAERALESARNYLVAVQFFTRLPVRGALARWVGYSPARLRASAAHFPGVGWLVGVAACVTFALLYLALPATPHTALAAAVGCTLVTVLLTGGFHEDGLADTLDGLGGATDRQRALEIMKDSRLGSFGALALVLGLLAKVALLAVLAAVSPAGVLAALLAGHVVSRFWPLVIIYSLPYSSDSAAAKSKPLADHIEPSALAVGAAWCLVPLGLAMFIQGAPVVLAGLACSGAALAWMRHWLARRLQGFTGDGLGATQQVCEVAFYLGAALALGRA